ncbi:uncharacterized protein LOC116712169 isoform X2 [Xiphophorus hellerii]|uniref:uncharacterized protein LOC116712169 isoform X2 n=1 Tax=Xiphophorus hellerii TaxID=8084 RepID=UPI0013B3663F|nr:uncharacterized protein LOC116712169 isoform X2 [Xiphophorus hellerii]
MATGSGWSAVVSSATAVINYPHQRSILKELTASPASPECLPVTVIPLTLWTRGPEPGSFPGFRTTLVTPWKIPTGCPSSQTHLSVVLQVSPGPHGWRSNHSAVSPLHPSLPVRSPPHSSVCSWTH